MRFDEDDEARLRAILTWRRDVRHFRPDPLSAADLAALKAAIDLAPSVGASQPWRILQAETPSLRAAVQASFEAENAAAAETYDGERQAAYRALKLAGLREAPVHLAVFTELEPEAGHGLGRRTMPEMLAYSTICAVHTLWLAARARNLGVGWVSILDPARIEALFDAPPSWRFTAYLCIGHPAFADDRPELERRGWQARGVANWEIR